MKSFFDTLSSSLIKKEEKRLISIGNLSLIFNNDLYSSSLDRWKFLCRSWTLSQNARRRFKIILHGHLCLLLTVFVWTISRLLNSIEFASEIRRFSRWTVDHEVLEVFTDDMQKSLLYLYRVCEYWFKRFGWPRNFNDFVTL